MLSTLKCLDLQNNVYYRDEDFKDRDLPARTNKNSYNDYKTTSKTKNFEGFTSDKDYLTKLKEKRLSSSDANFRQLLPGEIGQYENDNLLSTIKNTLTNESKGWMTSQKRVSLALINTQPNATKKTEYLKEIQSISGQNDKDEFSSTSSKVKQSKKNKNKKSNTQASRSGFNSQVSSNNWLNLADNEEEKHVIK